jgi:3-phosphoshikimate 1-carboxyvinyltransferase
VIIHGQKQLEGGITLDGHRDHRIVMALAVLCAACEKPLRIIGADAVHKSWPGFFRDLVIAGMKVAFDGSVQSTQFNPMNK